MFHISEANTDIRENLVVYDVRSENEVLGDRDATTTVTVVTEGADETEAATEPDVVETETEINEGESEAEVEGHENEINETESSGSESREDLHDNEGGTSEINHTTCLDHSAECEARKLAEQFETYNGLQDKGYVDVRAHAHVYWWLFETQHEDGAAHRPLIMWLQVSIVIIMRPL